MGSDYPGALQTDDMRSEVRQFAWPRPSVVPDDDQKGISSTKERGKVMTQEEMGATINRLEMSVTSLTDEWTEFLKAENKKRETDAEKAKTEADAWQKKQTFLHKHGAKILGFLFAAVSSGLAWYGSKIRSEIQVEQRAEAVDAGIEANTDSIVKVKDDVQDLQLDSVNQTIMIQKGFERIDKAMILAHPRQFPDENALPPVDEEFKTAADAAVEKKTCYEKFGKLRCDRNQQ